MKVLKIAGKAIAFTYLYLIGAAVVAILLLKFFITVLF